jgi:hypothetical protein
MDSEPSLQHAHALGVGRGLGREHGFLDDGRQIDALHVEAHLAREDAAHVEQVVDHLRLAPRVAVDDVDGLGEGVGLLILAQRGHPAEDGVERRAQLVRSVLTKSSLMRAARWPRNAPRVHLRAAPGVRRRGAAA